MSVPIAGKTMVVTGASSGFGRATTLHMARQGWHVFATVRKDADADDLLAEARTHGAAERITPIRCDITDDAHVAALGVAVAEATPRLDALVNNAGTAYAGPLELVPLADLRAQLAVNTVAQVAVTQALLPRIKAAKGTIINVSSVGGLVAGPGMGPYSASKFALEALSDALRVELAHFGVRVVIIEPTGSPTNIWQTSLDRGMSQLTERGAEYAPLIASLGRFAERGATTGFPAQVFADLVAHIVASPRPRARYLIPTRAGRVFRLARVLPSGLVDRIIRRGMGW